MVVGNPDHSLQADIVFVIEGTATNGAYINDLKTNYIVPSLECFTQGNIEERDYISENSNAYGIVVYQAADCLPNPSSDTFGPFSNASRLLNALDKLELIGGKGESHANVAEGLATALQCFEELQHKREPGIPAQKHCILVCNSPPYSLPVMESYQFSGKTAEQLAAVLLERGINLSVLSPRKIPALFKLFEKAGGDLSTSQTKNYAKDPRHLVLLKGFCLKERPISPPPGVVGTQPQSNTTTNISLPSPLSNNDSPMPNAQQTNQSLLGQNGQPGVPSSVSQGPVFRPGQIQPGLQQPMPQHNQNMVGGMVGVGRPGPGYMGGSQFNPQQLQPPGYPVIAGRPPRWPMMPPQPRQPCVQPTNTQGSALIAQLTQPPSMSATANVNVNQFGQMTNAGQMNPQQQQAIRLSMLNNQPNQQQNQSATLSQNQQPVSTANVVGQQQQQQQSMVNQQVSAANAVTVQAPVTSQANPTQQNQQMGRERHTIWHGVLEWIEKAKNPTDQQKLTRHVPCSVSTTLKDGEPELKADSWPQKLIMQLMPKQLIGSIGGMYLRNSKSVLFHPQNCEALESLTKVMSTGFAGCVHFTSLPSPSTCDIKVLILLYTAEKRAYLGFIPNDQAAFVDRLRKVIQQQKSSQQLGRQGQEMVMSSQVGTGVPGGSGLPSAPGQQMGSQQQINTPNSQPPNSQQGIMLSQTNTMAMGGGQITQNVVTSTSQPNQTGIGVLGQQVNPSTMSPRMSLQGMPQQGPPTSQNQQTVTNQNMRPNMMGVPQQRPPFDHLEAARQQNLEKILQLKQTLEAAQQQEAQYKSQLEIISHMKTQQLQEALQVAQQQEMQYKLQMDMQQQQQQQRQLNSQGGPQPAANQQRLMRPVLTNNPGLRHLLQQQPQYRQQLIGMQQMSGGGPRPQQMGQQMQNTSNQSQQQFDDVSSFDFM